MSAVSMFSCALTALKSCNVDDKKAGLISILCVAVINLIKNVILVLGAYKKKKMFFIPWLATTALGFVGSALFCIFIIIYAMTEYFGLGLAIFFLTAPIHVIYGYIWLCVLSFYTKLKEEDALNIIIVMGDTNRLIVNDPAEETMAQKLSEDKPPAYNDINNV